MKLAQLLCPEAIETNCAVRTKEQALRRLLELMAANGNLADAGAFEQSMRRREEEGCTALGHGVAIPHGRTSAVRRAAVSAITAPDGVDFGAPDGEPVRLVFLIAAPEAGEHLEVLSRLALLLTDEETRARLMGARDPEHFLRLLREADVPRAGAGSVSQPDGAGCRIVAVTACPSGIAHTYIAAKNLAAAAARLGVAVKVETDGARGVENALTNRDIAACEGVIVAADTSVEVDRFDGKRVLFCRSSDGIRRPEELIRALLGKEAPIFRAQGVQRPVHREEQNAPGLRRLYAHIMNGVSHMLPFVTAGGLLIACAFLADSLLTPGGNPASFGGNSPLSRFLGVQVGRTAFNFMRPVLAGYIAKSIADRPGLMAGFVGGAIAGGGGAGFPGALLAGLIAGYLTLLAERVLRRLPGPLGGTGTAFLLPVLSLLLTGTAVVFGIVPVASRLDAAIAGALGSMETAGAVALGVLLGAMMSVDLGGPVGKAAYVFATATLMTPSGDLSYSVPMACVMLGGMLPPLAVGCCALLFGSRFTRRERRQAFTCLLTGFCFITEGAIPIAAGDPVRVLPACAVGSAVTGGLCAAFGCSVPAPHGGIFLMPIVHRPLMGLAALGIGTAVAVLLLAALKRPLSDF